MRKCGKFVIWQRLFNQNHYRSLMCNQIKWVSVNFVRCIKHFGNDGKMGYSSSPTRVMSRIKWSSFILEAAKIRRPKRYRLSKWQFSYVQRQFKSGKKKKTIDKLRRHSVGPGSRKTKLTDSGASISSNANSKHLNMSVDTKIDLKPITVLLADYYCYGFCAFLSRCSAILSHCHIHSRQCLVLHAPNSDKKRNTPFDFDIIYVYMHVSCT